MTDAVKSSILAAYPFGRLAVVGAFEASFRNENRLVADGLGRRYVLRRTLQHAHGPRIAFQVRFQQHLRSLGLTLPCDEELIVGAVSPLAQPLLKGGFKIGNRIAIHPMEGWDGTADGNPSDSTIRRWRRFGQSGAKLIWGGEAVAVRPEGRANPNQLLLADHTLKGLADLRTVQHGQVRHDVQVAVHTHDGWRTRREVQVGALVLQHQLEQVVDVQILGIDHFGDIGRCGVLRVRRGRSHTFVVLKLS